MIFHKEGIFLCCGTAFLGRPGNLGRPRKAIPRLGRWHAFHAAPGADLAEVAGYVADGVES